jgi:hypothetical protein
MICYFCEKEGKKSKLDSHGCSTTLIGGARSYYDEQDNLHRHDLNHITSAYSCSNGHRFAIKKPKACPNPDCTFGKEEPTIINFDLASD